MKEKPNYAELEKRIDFTALAGKLGQLTEADNPQRKTVFTLLDKVREQESCRQEWQRRRQARRIGRERRSETGDARQTE